MSNHLPYTHLLYVSMFDVLSKDYQMYVYGVNTNDIFHSVGEFIYRSRYDIKLITWAVCSQEKLHYLSQQNIEIYNFSNIYD